jgi:hypothetical protein
LNPNWRKALVLLLIFDAWPDGATSFDISNIQDNVDKETETLDVLSPESATYFNEVRLTIIEGKYILIVCNRRV